MNDLELLESILSKSSEVNLEKVIMMGTNDSEETVYTKILVIKVMGQEIELFFDENDNIL